MKKTIFSICIIFSATLACNNTTQTQNNNIDSVSVTTEMDENIKEPEGKSGKLDALISDKPLIVNQLLGLKNALENKDQIKSMRDIENVLRMRDSLISLLLSDDDFNKYMEEGDRLYNEFDTLGISVVEAEGLYFGLDQAPIIEEIIEKIADEPYRLKNKIENLYAQSHGNEYPYYDISEEMKLIPLAEKMLNKYPGHQYNKKIAEILNNSLSPLVDVHQVNGSDTRYIVGGYDVNYYPGATDISFHKDFVEKQKNSKYGKIVSKILKSISTLEADEFDSLYFVQVPAIDSAEAVFADENLNAMLKKLPEEIKIQDSGFKYLWLGIDIPHVFYLRNNDEVETVYIYRFYDKKSPAQKGLEVIQKIIPSAKLVGYQLTEADKKNKN
ncbi:MAG: hypothetical protein P1P88_03985 [Bacteroidales bacterium]|nr:hypothetical protein [Bacteroidales bacterium]